MSFFEDTYTLPLTLFQRRMLDAMIGAGPRGITLEAIERLFTMDDRDDGEASPELRNKMRVEISRIRRIIEPAGWTIPRHRGGRSDTGLGAAAAYRLERKREKS